jgi:hypothetical protein
MREQKLEEKPLRFNADGELENVLYCTYCWTLNELDAQMCVSCGEYIADQGPDLRARLSRISHYASSVQSTGAETEGIGSVKAPGRPERLSRLVNFFQLDPFRVFLLLTWALGFIVVGLIVIDLLRR